MVIKFTTVALAACAIASTPAFAQRAPVVSDALIVAQNMYGDDDKSMQKQTNPRENGTSQSESKSGDNKNGQPQR